MLPTRNLSERNIKNEDKTTFSGDTDNTFIQFFRYVFVGGFAFVVDYGIMTALVELCRFDPVIAATISFVAGLLVNYVLSTFWIFKNSKIKNRLAEFAAFAAVGVVGLGINAAIIWLSRISLLQSSYSAHFSRRINIILWANSFPQ